MYLSLPADHLPPALAIARGLGDPPRQAEALHGLGIVQRLTGDYTAATASLQQALALSGDGDLSHGAGQAWALHDPGVVQQETGDYPAASMNLQHALALFGDLGHRHGQAWALRNLGVVQKQTGDYPPPPPASSSQLGLQRIERSLRHDLRVAAGERHRFRTCAEWRFASRLPALCRCRSQP